MNHSREEQLHAVDLLMAQSGEDPQRDVGPDRVANEEELDAIDVAGWFGVEPTDMLGYADFLVDLIVERRARTRSCAIHIRSHVRIGALLLLALLPLCSLSASGQPRVASMAHSEDLNFAMQRLGVVDGIEVGDVVGAEPWVAGDEEDEDFWAVAIGAGPPEGGGGFEGGVQGEGEVCGEGVRGRHDGRERQEGE